MKYYIWDTGALSLYFADHKVCKEYMGECELGKAKGYIPEYILLEFFYKQWRKYGRKIASYRVDSIKNSSLELLYINSDLYEKIAEFKVKNQQFSFADAILLGLAKERNAIILTTETPITVIKGIKAMKIDY